MVQPQEIEVWYVLPAIRREIAKELLDKGVKQKDIAVIMGLTKSAVSQYLSSKRAKEIVFSKEIKKEIKKATDKIYKNPKSLTVEIQKIVQLVRNTGTLCKYHKDRCEVDEKCVVCIE